MRSRAIRSWMSLGSSGPRVAALDFALCAVAICLGYWLRLSIIVSPIFQTPMFVSAAIFPTCVVVGGLACGVYRVHWPQAGIGECVRLARGYALGAAFFLAADVFSGYVHIPRSSMAFALTAGLLFLFGLRSTWRLLELSRERDRRAEAKKTLIIGAGEAGAYIARDLAHTDSGLEPLGFIDDDPAKRDKIIAGLSVLGGDADLEDVASRLGAKVALIAIPSAGGASLRKYLDILSRLGVEVRVLPSLRELAGGTVELSSMRHVELQDLLRRDAIVLDEHGIGSVIAGKRVLVTGAGGSIGSELCAQIARHSPAKIFMLGHGETSIYNISQSFIESGIDTPIERVIGDIADRSAMERVFDRISPQVVFHAAAHKHVPLMEENPREALRVNALGTATIADLAGRAGADKFVMISTDKAVHPTSVMGATKRIAERMLRAAQAAHKETAYITVRFGNVLGSRGSVVPLFERQIARGGPVTVTHPDMTRYFMLIPEAVSLVLQAASMGRGGELFVLDMGEPVKIVDMAETLIRLHGLEPDRDIKIEFTGIRPGEKLFEELFYDRASVDVTAHAKIFLSRFGGIDRPGLAGEIGDLLASRASDDEISRRIFDMADEGSKD